MVFKSQHTSGEMAYDSNLDLIWLAILWFSSNKYWQTFYNMCISRFGLFSLTIIMQTKTSFHDFF